MSSPKSTGDAPVTAPKKQQHQQQQSKKNKGKEKEAAHEDSAHNPNPNPKPHHKSSAAMEFDDPARRKKAAKQQVVALQVSAKQVALFSHLPQYERPVSVLERVRLVRDDAPLHPAVVALGLQYARRGIVGSTARTLALLDALEAVVRDWTPASDKPPALDLEQRLRPQIQYLSDCRPLGVGMGQAIKAIKRTIGTIAPHTPHPHAQATVADAIRAFRDTKILGASESIVRFGVERIRSGDVVVTLGHSAVVSELLVEAHREGLRFTVVVLDAPPRCEGRTLLRRLLAAGLSASYALLPALAQAMRGATKVLLGAHGLLGNGALLARCGSAAVASAAHARHVPVLVCCESYKFIERVQLDALTYNELEDPHDLLAHGPLPPSLAQWRTTDHLTLLLLAYDLTRPELITGVICELGIIPPTSVPVVLRESSHRTDSEATDAMASASQ